MARSAASHLLAGIAELQVPVKGEGKSPEEMALDQQRVDIAKLNALTAAAQATKGDGVDPAKRARAAQFLQQYPRALVERVVAGEVDPTIDPNLPDPSMLLSAIKDAGLGDVFKPIIDRYDGSQYGRNVAVLNTVSPEVRRMAANASTDDAVVDFIEKSGLPYETAIQVYSASQAIDNEFAGIVRNIDDRKWLQAEGQTEVSTRLDNVLKYAKEIGGADVSSDVSESQAALDKELGALELYAAGLPESRRKMIQPYIDHAKGVTEDAYRARGDLGKRLFNEKEAMVVNDRRFEQALKYNTWTKQANERFDTMASSAGLGHFSQNRAFFASQITSGNYESIDITNKRHVKFAVDMLVAGGVIRPEDSDVAMSQIRSGQPVNIDGYGRGDVKPYTDPNRGRGDVQQKVSFGLAGITPEGAFNLAKGPDGYAPAKVRFENEITELSEKDPALLVTYLQNMQESGKDPAWMSAQPGSYEFVRADPDANFVEMQAVMRVAEQFAEGKYVDPDEAVGATRIVMKRLFPNASPDYIDDVVDGVTQKVARKIAKALTEAK